MGKKEIIFAALQYNNGATMVANPLMGRCIEQLDHLLSPLAFIQTEPVSTITVSQGTSCLLMTWNFTIHSKQQ